ncbi:PRC-barrel domain-containing protein [Gracilibacillus sp. HCP3S3_G5_2]|uniref:PRC-barrel domain-containing protein n=1 Tax=Gracilibacillus sp. HCP3S3_G5_2 TaxID=3438941 RepID=UPI003F8AF55F
MLYKASSIESCNVRASDDELGKVKDLYFDSEKWTVRYLVIDTMKWLPGLRVLLSPVSFDTVDLSNDQISVLASKQQIKDGPSVDEHRPVSRKKEMDLHAYYGWHPYWIGNGLWGTADMPIAYQPNEVTREVMEKNESIDDGDPYLRSVNELKGHVTGYTVKAIDEDVGNVIDFVIDDQSWAIHYLIIDTGDWLPGKKIALLPELIDSIDWNKKELTINLKSDEVEKESIEDESILNLDEVTAETLRKRSLVK